MVITKALQPMLSQRRTLHGKRPTQLDTCVEALRRPSTTLEQEKKAALQALKKLFRQARGVREQGEQRRRAQRQGTAGRHSLRNEF